jgi:hypothetical protein
VAPAAVAADGGDPRVRFIPRTRAVSRIRYDGNTVVNPAPFPDVFSDPTVSRVQGSNR